MSLNGIFTWICMTGAVLWTVVISPPTTLVFLLNRQWGHALHRLWAKGILWFMKIQVRWIDLENVPSKGGLVIAPNHQSGFDIYVMASSSINFRWVSKAEVGKLPFVGWVMQAMGTYFVRRDKSGRDLRVMQKAEEDLQNGIRIVSFPEGTRTRTGELLPFKKGAFKTAQNAGVPLLPIAIKGTFEIAKPGEFPTRNHFVTVKVGKPFPVPKDALLENVMIEYRVVLRQLLESIP